MFNILVEQLPETVEIGGVEYAVDTDYRAALRVILAAEDPELTEYERQVILLDNLYPESPPDEHAREAIEAGMWFLDCGEKHDDDDRSASPRLLSFAKDARFIYAAFRQTHGIDLSDVDHLHWWKFFALFMDLGNETAFCNLVSFRKRVLGGTASKEEMKVFYENQDLYDLSEPEQLTMNEQDRLDEFLRLVEEAKEKRRREKAGG